MKTVIEMAREADLIAQEGYQGTGWFWGHDNLERFAELVRADERDRLSKKLIQDFKNAFGDDTCASWAVWLQGQKT